MKKTFLFAALLISSGSAHADVLQFADGTKVETLTTSSGGNISQIKQPDGTTCYISTIAGINAVGGLVGGATSSICVKK